MVAIRRSLSAVWLCLLLAMLSCGAGLHAQEDANNRLDKAKAGLDVIEQQLKKDTLDENTLSELGEKVPPLRDEADAVASELEPRLQQIDDALKQLGPAPASGAAESPDVAADRTNQTRQRQATDEAVRRAHLLVVRADQIEDDIRGRQRDLFADRILVRSRSLFEPSLWLQAFAEAPRHLGAIRTLMENWSESAATNADPVRLGFFILSLIVALVLVWPVRRLIQAWGQRFTVAQAPATRLRRSAYAFWVVVVTTAAPGLAALSVYLGLTLTHFAPDNVLPLLRAAVWMSCFVAFATGLGRALLAPGRTSWRLPAISDELVQRVKPYPLWISAAAGLGVLLTVFNSIIGTALASAIVVNGLAALLLAAVFVLFLRALRKGRLQAQEAARAGGDDWIAPVVRLLAWVTIAVAVVAVAIGYTALALFLVRQLVWVSLVLAALYLLLVLTDDLVSGFAGTGSLDQTTAAKQEAPRNDALEQIAILLSGLVRLALIVVAALLIVAPWGVRSTDALTWTRRLSEGLASIGISIDLGTVVGALFILVLGVLLTRGVQRWLERSYLPHTRLDEGLKVSIRTGVGYAGVIVAVGLGLSALGLSLDKIAIVAGALSVGIGFGLQSIVSNFVSGLILLAERPIRAGDWVQVGTDQGNVQRISVRSTVIEMFDRSTLIVPNSDLITKPVRNWTHRNPIGRIQLNIGVVFGTDVTKVRAILTDAATSHPAVLCQPAVDVQINGTTDLGISFSVYAYVSSPRQVGSVRSDLFFTVLQRLHEENIRTTAAPS